MPRNKKGKKKSTKKKDNRNARIKIIQRDDIKKKIIPTFNFNGPYEAYIPKIKKCKCYAIKKTLNNTQIGFIICYQENDEIYIFMMDIDEEYRRKGYGSAVVDLLKSRASTIKLNGMTGQGEDVANAFWISQGFRLNPDEDVVDNLGYVYP